MKLVCPIHTSTPCVLIPRLLFSLLFLLPSSKTSVARLYTVVHFHLCYRPLMFLVLQATCTKAELWCTCLLMSLDCLLVFITAENVLYICLHIHVFKGSILKDYTFLKLQLMAKSPSKKLTTRVCAHTNPFYTMTDKAK